MTTKETLRRPQNSLSEGLRVGSSRPLGSESPHLCGENCPESLLALLERLHPNTTRAAGEGKKENDVPVGLWHRPRSPEHVVSRSNQAPPGRLKVRPDASAPPGAGTPSLRRSPRKLCGVSRDPVLGEYVTLCVER